MSINESINDVHVDAACALICAQWHHGLLTAKSQDASAAEAGVSSATDRVNQLKDIRPVPVDLADRIDLYFQPQRDRLVADIAKLELMIDDPATAALFYPDGGDNLNIGDRLATTRQMLGALDGAWTPQES